MPLLNRNFTGRGPDWEGSGLYSVFASYAPPGLLCAMLEAGQLSLNAPGIR